MFANSYFLLDLSAHVEGVWLSYCNVCLCLRQECGVYWSEAAHCITQCCRQHCAILLVLPDCLGILVSFLQFMSQYMPWSPFCFQTVAKVILTSGGQDDCSPHTENTGHNCGRDAAGQMLFYIVGIPQENIFMYLLIILLADFHSFDNLVSQKSNNTIVQNENKGFLV